VRQATDGTVGQPLDGVRVLDLSRMVAGGLAGMLLGDFGADVVKVEQPGAGDPLRQWTTAGEPLWWKVYGRNKRGITLNLRVAEGRALLLKLVPRFDLMIESFVPGTLEKWGLDWETLRAANPRLILVRISGWGQSGPASRRPGLGTLVEAASGCAAMTGHADLPILPSFPVADMTAGLYAVNAAMFALYHRDVHAGGGQVIDVSLFESLFSVLGPIPAEYAAAGKVRGRSANRSTNSAPRGCYLTSDGQWIAVSGSTPKMAARILESYGLAQLLQDPRFATNEARVRYAAELDAAVSRAIGERTLAENLAIIEANGLTAQPVQTIREIERDAHWRARGLLVDVPNGRDPVRMHDVVPRLSETPGGIRAAGPELGADNEAIYVRELGLDADEFAQLQERGIV
jgi:crotonobetainyl-CoA:carnitine CoA-transferase CaiB-like acyl-CoA transferase